MIFTVIGLVDNTSGELTVAGVVRGDVSMVDTFAGTHEAQRYATSVTADNPADAEQVAQDEYRESL